MGGKFHNGHHEIRLHLFSFFRPVATQKHKKKLLLPDAHLQLLSLSVDLRPDADCGRACWQEKQTPLTYRINQSPSCWEVFCLQIIFVPTLVRLCLHSHSSFQLRTGKGDWFFGFHFLFQLTGENPGNEYRLWFPSRVLACGHYTNMTKLGGTIIFLLKMLCCTNLNNFAHSVSLMNWHSIDYKTNFINACFAKSVLWNFMNIYK